MLPNEYRSFGFVEVPTWLLILKIAHEYGTRALLVQLDIVDSKNKRSSIMSRRNFIE